MDKMISVDEELRARLLLSSKAYKYRDWWTK